MYDSGKGQNAIATICLCRSSSRGRARTTPSRCARATHRHAWHTRACWDSMQRMLLPTQHRATLSPAAIGRKLWFGRFEGWARRSSRSTSKALAYAPARTHVASRAHATHARTHARRMYAHAHTRRWRRRRHSWRWKGGSSVRTRSRRRSSARSGMWMDVYRHVYRHVL